MGTGTTVRAWSTTVADNDDADTDIASSDTMAPDALDNVDRTIMAAVKRQEDDSGGALAAGGTANALTVTTTQLLTSAQLVAGVRLLIRATADNTSATVTFAPDGLTARNIKRADGTALAVGSIKSGMYLDLVYNVGSTEWRCANIPPLVTGGLVFLESGTWSSVATGDIVLTSYTGFRGLKFMLSGLRPATDAVRLYMRFSTDGGATYDATGYNYSVMTHVDSLGSVGTSQSGSDVAIFITGSDKTVGSATTEGVNAEVTILNQTSAAFWTRAHFIGHFIDSTATPAGVFLTGGGAREAAQDTDAVRFLFSSGNITAGNYAVYGLV